MLVPLASVLALMCIGAPVHADLLGVTYDGTVLRIVPSTGAASAVGAVGNGPHNSMTRDGQGRFLTATIARSLAPQLHVVDPVLGTGTFLNDSFLNDVRALACSPAGVVYAIDAEGSGVQNRLVRLDLSVGTGDSSIVQFIAYTSISGIVGMAFASDGTLHAWSVSAGLITVDPTNGACIDLDGTWDGTSEIQTLAFAPDGTLYGAYDDLYVLDRTTGARTPIASGTFADVRGMEWIDIDAPISYCHAKMNSEGCLPFLFSTGTASFSGADDFHIRAANVLNNKAGFLLWSRTATEVPFQGGSLCLAPTIFRTPAQFSGGSPPPNDCSGTFDYHFQQAHALLRGLAAGDEVCAQFLYRDPPHLDGTGIGLTGALRFRWMP